MNSYLQLFLRGIKNGPTSDNSLAVAFTSSGPGEGVTYVTQSFGMELARRTRKHTIITDVESLQKIDIFHYSQASKHCCKTDVPYLYVLQKDEDEFPELIEESHALVPRTTAGNEFEQGVSNLNTLKYMFDFILIDCPSIKESGDAIFFAAAADGAMLVVEAEKTRKEQVRSAISTMQMADANILGTVLNKRRYPIPNWIYRRV